MKIYSYVVEHDSGLSPNPTGGFCTLAFCKFTRDGITPNIVELARVGDWVAGTGGKCGTSAGHGRLVYAMRVTEKMTLRDYFRDPRFCTPLQAGCGYRPVPGPPWFSHGSVPTASPTRGLGCSG
jgi:hypothetical protein